jgi:8-oxo-dGTP pyrophosphatase MutT (NUDIX family)
MKGCNDDSISALTCNTLITKGQLVKRAISSFVENYLRPLVQRPEMLQAAALCYRTVEDEKQVLLITSRGTGRWIIPKGWPMRGLDASQAAAVEAWEEAGVHPVAPPSKTIGDFTYRKIKGSGLPVKVKVLVYPLEVARLADDFREAGQRKRKWVSVQEAAQMVSEPGLQALFQKL